MELLLRRPHSVSGISAARWFGAPLRSPVSLLLACFLGCAAPVDQGGRPAQRIESAAGGPVGAAGGPEGVGSGSAVPGVPGVPGSPGASSPGAVTPGGVADTLVVIDDCGAGNAAGLDAASVQTLELGGAVQGRMLYPYDGTVFPRGMRAPTLMWEGGPADAVYLRIYASNFDYRGCLRPTGEGQLVIPQEVWERAGASSLGAREALQIEVTTLRGSSASGPLRGSIVIAQASVKGSIYYNSYSSKLAAQNSLLGGIGVELGGAVLRIPPGGEAEVFVGGGENCQGCHSVSAQGTRLLAYNGSGGSSYPISTGGAANPPASGTGSEGCFGALYPDGSVFLSTAGPVATCGDGLDAGSALYETDSGRALMGAGIPAQAAMPMFSPDGSLLVFNDFSQGNQTLAMMDFTLDEHRADNHRVLFQDQGALKPAWPFVLPDNQGVVFTRTASEQFSGEAAGIALDSVVDLGGLGLPGLGAVTAFKGPLSDLYMADVATGQVTLLARAMGFETPAAAETGQSYLPFGDEELHQNYFPTVSPVAAGGYFWVFFDSLRHYGNQGLQRQLWGAAVTVSADGDYSVDRSHPAFYVAGQEFGTGNHRAFTALDACREDGASCSSGVDCCAGFCTALEGGSGGVCGLPPEPRCAMADEACGADSPCCDAEQSCINGFCSVIII